MTKEGFLTIGGYAGSRKLPKKQHYLTLEERQAHEEAVMEEAAKPTGFDILLENKEKGLESMRKLFKAEPSLTRTQLSMRLNLSMRTVYRYLRILREGRNEKFTAVDVAISEKIGRKQQLIKLMKEHPEYSRTQLAEELEVSRKTLYDYLAELGLV